MIQQFFNMVLIGAAIILIVEILDDIRIRIHGKEACKKFDEEWRKEMNGEDGK